MDAYFSPGDTLFERLGTRTWNVADQITYSAGLTITSPGLLFIVTLCDNIPPWGYTRLMVRTFQLLEETCIIHLELPLHWTLVLLVGWSLKVNFFLAWTEYKKLKKRPCQTDALIFTPFNTQDSTKKTYSVYIPPEHWLKILPVRYHRTSILLRRLTWREKAWLKLRW